MSGKINKMKTITRILYEGSPTLSEKTDYKPMIIIYNLTIFV